MRNTKRKGFNFLRSYFDVLNELKTDKDKLQFLTAIINKQFLDEDPKDLEFIVNLCYQSQRHQIEKSLEGWKKATGEDTPQGPYQGTPKGSTEGPRQEEEVQVQVEVEVKEEEKEETPKPPKRGLRFKAPTLEEVKNYCLERKNKVDAEAFIDFYESKGWLVGKNKMKDWKAAIRTWEKRTANGDKRNSTNGARATQNREGFQFDY